jgi:hypothetical protein
MISERVFLYPWVFANPPLLGAEKDLRRGVVRMTLERGKKVEKEVIGGTVPHFMGSKWLWSYLFTRW